jgi:cobalt-zinc-cadmium efflux system membrane fusion protein
VREVRVDLGDAVKAGQVLVVISSPEIAGAKADLLQAAAEEAAATAEHDRERELHKAGISPEQDVIEAGSRARRAEAALRAASQRLVGLGLTPEEVRDVTRAEAADASLALRAPFAGTVVSRNAVIGDVVEPGREFIRVADLGTLWVDVSLPQNAAAGVRPGQPATIRHRDGPGSHEGVITWVADHVDPETGMVKARAEVPNPDRDLRAGTFVQVVLPGGETGPAALVPADAVHRFGGHPFVFVEQEADLFDVRRVDARPAGGDVMALLAGVSPEDRVVVEGSYLIKSEFQKSRLGAGCGD